MGARRHTKVDGAFLAGPDFTHLRSISTPFRELRAPFSMSRDGKDPVEFNLLYDLVKKLEEFGGKGSTISRYKGLGEMNAEQLWETTMDPERRVILQVQMNKSEQENDIFETLMGDQVEPRREFIERNALEVSNLDV
jgi:DNA gyrase subunit B